MHIRESQHFAVQILRQNRTLSLKIWGVIAAGGLLWLTELSVAAAVAQFTAAELLTDKILPWRLIQLGFGIPIWIGWALCRRLLWRSCAEAIGIPPAKVRESRKSWLLAALQNTLLRTVLLQTVTLCLYGAYRLGLRGAAQAESAPYLFWATQLLVLGTLCFLGWCYLCMGLWCVPTVYFAMPRLPLWKLPLFAMRAMRGARRELFALFGWYGVQMLPLVTIPWVLPQLTVSVVTAMYIRVATMLSDSLEKSLA